MYSIIQTRILWKLKACYRVQRWKVFENQLFGYIMHWILFSCSAGPSREKVGQGKTDQQKKSHRFWVLPIAGPIFPSFSCKILNFNKSEPLKKSGPGGRSPFPPLDRPVFCSAMLWADISWLWEWRFIGKMKCNQVNKFFSIIEMKMHRKTCVFSFKQYNICLFFFLHSTHCCYSSIFLPRSTSFYHNSFIFLPNLQPQFFSLHQLILSISTFLHHLTFCFSFFLNSKSKISKTYVFLIPISKLPKFPGLVLKE